MTLTGKFTKKKSFKNPDLPIVKQYAIFKPMTINNL